MNGNKAPSAVVCLAASVVMAGADAQTPSGPVSRPPIVAASAGSEAAAGEARIPFANHGGIYNWQVVNDRTILIQAQNRMWYKATLFSPCLNLPFAERLGFQSNADGSFDKFSSIRVGRQNCPLVSLVPTTAPAKNAKSHKQAGPAMSGSAPAPAAGANGTPTTNPQ